jgi:hypothetical protein
MGGRSAVSGAAGVAGTLSGIVAGAVAADVEAGGIPMPLGTRSPSACDSRVGGRKGDLCGAEDDAGAAAEGGLMGSAAGREAGAASGASSRAGSTEPVSPEASSSSPS